MDLHVDLIDWLVLYCGENRFCSVISLSGASYNCLVASVKAIFDGDGRAAIPHKSRSHMQILDIKFLVLL